MIAYNRVVKNALWIIICKIVQALIALAIGTISARYLGPSNYGLINYAKSVVEFIVPVAQLGMRHTLVEEVVTHPDREGKTVGTSLVMTVFSSLICIVGCLTFVSIANAGETDTLIVCALYSISLIFQMLEMIQYWFQAKLLSKYISVIALIAYIVVSIYKVFLLVTQKSIYWFAISYTFDFLIISVSLIFFYYKIGTQKLSFSFDLAKKMFSRSKYYIVSSLMTTLYTQTDKIMIKTMLGNEEIGFYSTAANCAAMAAFVFWAVIDSLRPVIYESKKTDYKSYEKNTSILYSVIIYMGIAQGIVLTLFAKPVVALLYGKDYMAAVPVLQIVTWCSLFSYLGTVRSTWMLAEEKQKYLWMINLSGAVLNIIGNFILIPLVGTIGAAVASLTTQIFANVAMCAIIKPIRPTLKLMWRGLNPKLAFSMLKNFKK